MRTRLRQHSPGFTIIELAVTCLIIAVLATITIAGFSSWLPSYRLKTAARDLYSNMQQAKMAAIKQEGNCTITYTTAPDKYVVTGVTRTVILADYGSGVRFQGDSGQSYSPAVITFNSRGMCSGSVGWAYLSNEKQSAYYRVGPNASGIIKMEQYAGSWPSP